MLLAVLMLAVLLAGHWLADAVGEALLPHSSVAPFVLAREALSDSTEVIFVGSSHVLLGIRPDAFPFEAMNVTGPGWDYRAMEAAVRANLVRMPNLKLAVIELDLFPMRIDTPTVQRGRCQALRVWGISQEEVPCQDRVVDEGSLGGLVEVLVPSPRLTPQAIWETVKPRFVGPIDNRVPIPGHRSFLAVGDPEAHGPRRVEWLEGVFGSRYVDPNGAALERLTARLRGRGVDVVLLRMPHQGSFTSSVPETWTLQIADALRRLQAASEVDLSVWNYERAAAFEPHDFMDSVHLNSSGVKKLGALLGSRVRANLDR